MASLPTVKGQCGNTEQRSIWVNLRLLQFSTRQFKNGKRAQDVFWKILFLSKIKKDVSNPNVVFCSKSKI